MTDHDIAAGLYRLAKAHRHKAHHLRTMVNILERKNFSDVHIYVKYINEHRASAKLEDQKALFLKAAAALAKVGACQIQIERLKDELVSNSDEMA